MKTVLITFLSLLVLSGCADKTVPITEKDSKNSKDNPNPQVVQTDRYTLVDLEDPTKNYVLDQIIDTSLPKNLSLTVKDGMSYVLNQSGYTLCNASLLNVLYEKKLPKIQYKIGPVKLSEALKIMAGPAWKLTVDDVEREACFVLNNGYKIKSPPADLIIQTPTNSKSTKTEIYEMPPKEIKATSSNVKKSVDSTHNSN